MIQLLVATHAERPGPQVVLVYYYCAKRTLRPTVKECPGPFLQKIITFYEDDLRGGTALLPFGSLKEIF